MKVLWLTNMPIPELAGQIGLAELPYGGWLTGFFQYLKRQRDVSIVTCFLGQSWGKGEVEAGRYYSFPLARIASRRYVDSLIQYFRGAIQAERPDIIHIFGTEFCHAYAMTQAAGAERVAERVVINIQGLCAPWADRYYDLLPLRVIYGGTLYDARRMSFVWLQKLNFSVKARYERLALKGAAHIVGRTDWDKALSGQIQPRARYHFCNEILRPAFYRPEPGWAAERCQRHSLFMGQGAYPIKGVHAAIEALATVAKRYPDVKLFVAGPKLNMTRSALDWARSGVYERHVARLIRRHGLQDNVCFLGPLDEEQMRKRLAESHALILTSFVENESNSVSEAKLVGTPVVASFVGGIPNRVRHGEDGFCYPPTAPYMLAHYILRLFEDDALAASFSQKGRMAARALFDPEANGRTLMRIYEDIAAQQCHSERQAEA